MFKTYFKLSTPIIQAYSKVLKKTIAIVSVTYPQQRFIIIMESRKNTSIAKSYYLHNKICNTT